MPKERKAGTLMACPLSWRPPPAAPSWSRKPRRWHWSPESGRWWWPGPLVTCPSPVAITQGCKTLTPAPSVNQPCCCCSCCCCIGSMRLAAGKLLGSAAGSCTGTRPTAPSRLRMSHVSNLKDAAKAGENWLAL